MEKDRRRSPFEYAIVRVVPRVERGEQLNAGIVVFCRAKRFLGARVELDEDALRALAPECEPSGIRSHLDAIPRICAGDPASGPIARLPMPDRFRWLVAPSSTMIQPSEVHAGLTDDPRRTLDHLFRKLVVRQGESGDNGNDAHDDVEAPTKAGRDTTMTDRDRIGDQRHARDEPGRTSEPAPGLDPGGERPRFESEPLAGEGTDEEEATMTAGPGHSAGSGVAGEGTTEEVER